MLAQGRVRTRVSSGSGVDRYHLTTMTAFSPGPGALAELESQQHCASCRRDLTVEIGVPARRTLRLGRGRLVPAKMMTRMLRVCGRGGRAADSETRTVSDRTRRAISEVAYHIRYQRRRGLLDWSPTQFPAPTDRYQSCGGDGGQAAPASDPGKAADGQETLFRLRFGSRFPERETSMSQHGGIVSGIDNFDRNPLFSDSEQGYIGNFISPNSMFGFTPQGMLDRSDAPSQMGSCIGNPPHLSDPAYPNYYFDATSSSYYVPTPTNTWNLWDTAHQTAPIVDSSLATVSNNYLAYGTILSEENQCLEIPPSHTGEPEQPLQHLEFLIPQSLSPNLLAPAQNSTPRYPPPALPPASRDASRSDFRTSIPGIENERVGREASGRFAARDAAAVPPSPPRAPPPAAMPAVPAAAAAAAAAASPAVDAAVAEGRFTVAEALCTFLAGDSSAERRRAVAKGVADRCSPPDTERVCVCVRARAHARVTVHHTLFSTVRLLFACCSPPCACLRVCLYGRGYKVAKRGRRRGGGVEHTPCRPRP